MQDDGKDARKVVNNRNTQRAADRCRVTAVVQFTLGGLYDEEGDGQCIRRTVARDRRITGSRTCRELLRSSQLPVLSDDRVPTLLLHGLSRRAASVPAHGV